MDLACRSGERLTGESDRWPFPGPTAFSFLRVSVCLSACSSSSHPRQPPPCPPSPSRAPEAAGRSVGQEQKPPEDCPGAQAWQVRGTSSGGGAFSAGRNHLGPPPPQPWPAPLPQRAPSPQPSSLLVGAVRLGQLCESRSCPAPLPLLHPSPTLPALPQGPMFCVASFSSLLLQPWRRGWSSFQIGGR